ncbi:sensor histidine kinase [Bradyrhizobium canariense]|uniref:histidine kinase n=1 Tax=Bradyrhizobium canariense TaxID=255045 RepID=A0A1H2B8S7_9BRAD|nr:sensor histidine kinase [Bradyrhizobium canariense]SDT54631.1 two-component system, chemotaxis family, CheB/CheR fusion protein [Bradyrhizobium canariense]
MKAEDVENLAKSLDLSLKPGNTSDEINCDSRESSASVCEQQGERMEAGPSLNLLVDELQHRIRNLLTVVQCFVSETESSTADEYRAALSARIAGLSDAYNLIERTRVQHIALSEVLEQTLKSYAAVRKNRIRAAGPDVELEPRLALSLHMALHELATNASKYGAFTTASGQVEVLWELLSDGAGRRLAIQWRERGGPEVREPDRKGFGLRLITKVLRNAQVELSFDRAGFVCQMLIEIDES